MLALNLHACHRTANPVQNTARIEVLIRNDTPLGRKVAQRTDDPDVIICTGCTDLRYRTITDPEEIARVTGFINQRIGFWNNGWPITKVKLRFYDDADALTGSFDINLGSFSRGGAYGGARAADRHEIKELAGYLGLDPLEVWDGERAQKWLRLAR